MRATFTFLFLLNIAAGVASAQSVTQHKPDADRLGMTCAQILKMSSSEWIVYFGQKAQTDKTSSPDAIFKANVVYGKCYDVRTEALAASLARAGKGPSKAARADFAGFEAALKDFSAIALADTQPVADAQKRSYAALYEKQFRYGFYEKYQPKGGNAGDVAQKSAPSAGPPNQPKDSKSSASAAAAPAAASDTDEMTKAKNRVGELLGAAPEEKLHELHAAFGAILGQHEVDYATRLAVYRYAIFLLEPTSGKSSYAPPF
jgi:hypothetical protein